MLCAISGEAPEIPVVSKKSGNVFEKRLIEAYLAEKGTDPVTGEELSLDDLLEIKSDRTVRPRPPTLTSIPSLLSIFQNEWDALALESFTLKQQLSQTRQELSTALYHNDAAVRVIARLTEERDAARDALSRVSINDRRATTSDESMQVDGQTLPESIVTSIQTTQEQLSGTRRKRPVPQGWATSDDIQAFEASGKPVPAAASSSRVLALHEDANSVLLGGAKGDVSILTLSDKNVVPLAADLGSITDGLWWNTNPVVASADGAVTVLSNGKAAHVFRTHAGAATGLALHPTGSILASVGVDKSFVLYNLDSGAKLAQVFTDAELLCCDFHPDGHLLGAGGADGNIKLFDVKTLTNVANFDCSGPLQSISFSENGTWLAAITRESNNAGIWDLRKSAEIKSLDMGSNVFQVRWDYTGQYLLGAGASGITIQHYNKSAKSWSDLLSKAVSSMAAVWGANAKSVIALSAKGEIVVLQ